jgi:hypothetical protein
VPDQNVARALGREAADDARRDVNTTSLCDLLLLGGREQPQVWAITQYGNLVHRLAILVADHAARITVSPSRR